MFIRQVGENGSIYIMGTGTVTAIRGRAMFDEFIDKDGKPYIRFCLNVDWKPLDSRRNDGKMKFESIPMEFLLRGNATNASMYTLLKSIEKLDRVNFWGREKTKTVTDENGMETLKKYVLVESVSFPEYEARTMLEKAVPRREIMRSARKATVKRSVDKTIKESKNYEEEYPF